MFLSDENTSSVIKCPVSQRNQICFRMSEFPSFSQVSDIPRTCIPHFVYPFILQWALEWCCLFTTVNNAARSMDLQISLWDPAFHFLGHMPRRGIAGLTSRSIFNFPRNCRPVFHGSCTLSHARQPCADSSLSTSSLALFPSLEVLGLRVVWLASPSWLVVLRIFSCACWPFTTYLLWRNASLSLLSIF